MVKLAIVLPCYNEEEVLKLSAERLYGLYKNLVEIGKIDSNSFCIFVNDGSKDKTWQIIKELSSSSNIFKGLNLAYNVGHQNAIWAGMMAACGKCDAVITMDADLQDDINAVEKMINAFEDGNDVVYGVKVSRKADPFLKRLSAQAFYKLQNKLGSECIYNHADFRLLSNDVLQILSRFEERNLYLRGLIPMLGLKSECVDDVISERQAGSSKYTLGKMVNLAINGVTSLTMRPIMLIVPMGLIFLLISIIILIHVVYSYLTGSVVPGWSSIMISIWLVGGFCLLSIGLVGIYIGKIYTEVKRRPLYVVKEALL